MRAPFVLGGVVSTLLTGALLGSANVSRADTPSACKDSAIVFNGVVRAAHDAGTSDFPTAANNASVQVSRVISKAPTVPISSGQTLLVYLKSASSVKDGEEWQFCASTASYGNASIYVSEIGHYPPEHVARVGNAPGFASKVALSPAQTFFRKQLLAYAAVPGTVIVLGTIEAVPHEVGADGSNLPKSEHEQRFAKFPFAIDRVLQSNGASLASPLNVRIPISGGVETQDIPQLSAGQRRLLFLHPIATDTLGSRSADKPSYAITSASDILLQNQLIVVTEVLGK